MVVIHGRVYDLTDFGFAHPGSPEILRSVAGCDASARFDAARHSSFAETMMEEFELRETKLSCKRRNFIRWPLHKNRLHATDKTLDHHRLVPHGVLNAWVTSATCVERRHGRRDRQVPRETCTDAHAVAEGTSKHGNAFACPHCHGFCREAKIFAEWMGARHEGRDMNSKQAVAFDENQSEDSDENDVVENLSEVPHWNSPWLSVARHNTRRSLREQMRQLRAELQKQPGLVNAGQFISAAPPGTLTTM